MAIIYNPAPLIIPTATAQNVKTISAGSLIAVRKRTILRAPTIPKDNATHEKKIKFYGFDDVWDCVVD